MNAFPDEYRALIAITTCERPRYLRRYLPHFARFCERDPRFSLLVSLDGPEPETVRFCAEWGVPLIHSAEREGVGISKNRVLEAFTGFDYYFFVEDDVEVVDGSVFPAQVEIARASSIHHFSLCGPRRIRDYPAESVVAGRHIAHGFVGGAVFNFFTAAGLRQVGGWHPRFAEYRRWGHTEHSYRFFRTGLAPAPFNVVRELTGTCIWHLPPAVTDPARLPADGDELVAPERELIDRQLRHVPVRTFSAYEFNRMPFDQLDRLAATLDGGQRYPLVTTAERRHCRSDYQLWRYRSTAGAPRRLGALLAAAWEWPGNPMLRFTIKTAIRASDPQLVSVVLPCFEAERTLPAALDSLLRQTYADIEVVAVDDGSRDGTASVLADFASRDRRVRLLRNEANSGVICTLNRGVAEARGELVARMDADDLAFPTRIERQVEVLRRRPDIGVVGTGIEPVDREDHRLRPRPVLCTSPGGARFVALFATPVMHPTIAARTELMRAHPYGGSPESLHTEDYEMFARMLDAGVGFANVDEPLMRVRSDPSSVSARFEEIQVENFVRCARRHLERTLGVRPDPGPHRVLFNRIDATTGAGDLREGLRWLDRVESEFLRREPGSAAEIRRAADLQRVDVLVQAALKGAPAVRIAAGSLALRYGRRLLSGDSRAYLAGKFRPAATRL